MDDSYLDLLGEMMRDVRESTASTTAGGEDDLMHMLSDVMTENKRTRSSATYIDLLDEMMGKLGESEPRASLKAEERPPSTATGLHHARPRAPHAHVHEHAV
jgi:hypothetical protein